MIRFESLKEVIEQEFELAKMKYKESMDQLNSLQGKYPLMVPKRVQGGRRKKRKVERKESITSSILAAELPAKFVVRDVRNALPELTGQQLSVALKSMAYDGRIEIIGKKGLSNIYRRKA